MLQHAIVGALSAICCLLHVVILLAVVAAAVGYGREP